MNERHQQAEQLLVDISLSPKNRVIVVSGLPGVGKTTIAACLAATLKAVHINADAVRSSLTKHLGFSYEDRIEQGKTLGQIAKIVADSGHVAVVDYVAPVWPSRFALLNHIGQHRQNAWWFELQRPGHESRFKDTAKIYEQMFGSIAWGSAEKMHIAGFYSPLMVGKSLEPHNIVVDILGRMQS